MDKHLAYVQLACRAQPHVVYDLFLQRQDCLQRDNLLQCHRDVGKHSDEEL